MEQYIEKTCDKHGNQRHILEKSGYYRCKQCRYEAIKRRRNKIKSTLVEEFGGECFKCGYNDCLEAMEFHHLEPNKKSFSVSSARQLGMARIREEADKCLMFCCRCHREIEVGIAILEIT